ncbi:MAG: hypothetical protein NTY01_11845 [Verrucomicrobia bacterium]|nr:hypothetical protein [Verrucomicrobiota bacterium]
MKQAKAAQTSKPTPVLTPERRAEIEWRKKVKWLEYEAKSAEFHKAKPNNTVLSQQAIKAIHHFAEQDEWFAKNTPYPFEWHHLSPIPGLANLACEYLQQLARAGSHNAIEDIARLTVELTETLNDLLHGESETANENAELMKRVAAELPYWPMLQFRNTAANNHFPRVAEKLELGKECPINVSESANYSLQTPINRFVWQCLRHFQKVHWSMRHAEVFNQTIDETLSSLVFREYAPPVSHRRFVCGMIRAEEIPVCKKSYQLPLLTKSTAKQWADVAIMARLDAIEFDYLNAPEFEQIRKRKRVKSRGTARAEIRKDMISALHSMARPDAPKPAHS